MQPLEFIRKKPVIETERLIFRKMRVSDARDMYEYACKEETSRYLLWAPHSSYYYTVKLLRFLQGEYENVSFFDLAVIDKESGKMIGSAGFTSFDTDKGIAEIGYVLNPDYHGKGIATEALKVMTDVAFRILGASRVECKYLDGNVASLRVMQKCGMVHLGIVGQMLVQGFYRNYGVCYIEKEEYLKAQRAPFYTVKAEKGFLRALFYKN